MTAHLLLAYRQACQSPPADPSTLPEPVGHMLAIWEACRDTPAHLFRFTIGDPDGHGLQAIWSEDDGHIARSQPLPLCPTPSVWRQALEGIKALQEGRRHIPSPCPSWQKTMDAYDLSSLPRQPIALFVGSTIPNPPIIVALTLHRP